MNTEQERADFEAWWAASDHFLSDLDFCLMPDGRYEDDDVNVAWEAYQAGRASLQSQDREDALRYRWLRSAGKETERIVEDMYECALSGEDLDAAIDHARRAEEDL